MKIERRDFLKMSSITAAGLPFVDLSSLADALAIERENRTTLLFETTNSTYKSVYDKALHILDKNVIKVPGFNDMALIEGSVYKGIWMECAPHEGLVYANIRPDIAYNNHVAFFKMQRADGQFPAVMRYRKNGDPEIIWGQIQMVISIAATSLELFHKNNDSQFLAQAYTCCSKWDAWLRKYRNTRGTGLTEAFCTYDTGHDNSPRFKGMPNQCPGAEAKNLPKNPSLPWLAPDLSATTYGSRIALAEMAKILGKKSESDRWLAEADQIRKTIMDKLYVEEDGAFYDFNAKNEYIKVRGDLITRVLGEHVVDSKTFNHIYEKQIHNPQAFWGKFPLASIAMDDPTFVRPVPRNSWGGASQALTAIRAPRWMEHYGKPADFAYLMQQWIAAILNDTTFMSQVDPMSGIFTVDVGDYSPTALVFMDFTWRLNGVRAEKNQIEWNIRPIPKGEKATYEVKITPTLSAKLVYENGEAIGSINNKQIFKSKTVHRLVTDQKGNHKKIVGITDQTVHVALKNKKVISLKANQSITI